MALMRKDKRSKGCPNEGCPRHSKKYLYKAEDKYCVECGSELVFVCRDCFRLLTGEEPSITRCARCQAEWKDRLQKVRNAAATVAGGAAGVAAGAKVVTDRYGAVITKGAKAVAGRIIRN